jgi:hypothetical protein
MRTMGQGTTANNHLIKKRVELNERLMKITAEIIQGMRERMVGNMSLVKGKRD